MILVLRQESDYGTVACGRASIFMRSVILNVAIDWIPTTAKVILEHGSYMR